MNPKYSNILSNIVNEGLIGSFFFLSDLSLPSTGKLTSVVIETNIVKVWTCKGMISKLVAPLSGLIGSVTSCTTDGVARTLLLVLISHKHKTWGFIFEIRENNMVGLRFE